MKQHLQVSQEYIDNGFLRDSPGWQGPMSAMSTCPIAQALHYQGDYEWEGIKIARRDVEIDGADYTISEGVSDWIAYFDDWKWQDSGLPPCPISLIMDTDEHHITLANEEE